MIRVEHLIWNDTATGEVDAMLCAELCRRAFSTPIQWETARIIRHLAYPNVDRIVISAESVSRSFTP